MIDVRQIEAQTPFPYQMTEADCVPSTLLNALRYLFSRDSIPPEALMLINRLAMDEKSCWWEEEKLVEALESISDWLNRYKGGNGYGKFRVRAEILSNGAVNRERIGNVLVS
jgi:hypothetical protein